MIFELSETGPEIEIGTSPTPKTESMLNCPGAKPAQPSTSMSKVTTSESSGMRRVTLASTGTIGSECGSGASTVEIQQLHPGVVEPFQDHGHESFHHGIAKCRVGIALGPQAVGVERDGAGILLRARVEGPAVGRDQPGRAPITPPVVSVMKVGCRGRRCRSRARPARPGSGRTSRRRRLRGTGSRRA